MAANGEDAFRSIAEYRSKYYPVRDHGAEFDARSHRDVDESMLRLIEDALNFGTDDTEAKVPDGSPQPVGERQ